MAVVLGYRYGVGGDAGFGGTRARASTGTRAEASTRASAKGGSGVVIPREFSPMAVRVAAPALVVRRGGERLSTLDLYERSPVLLTGPGGERVAYGAPPDRRPDRYPAVLPRCGAGLDLEPEDPAAWGVCTSG